MAPSPADILDFWRNAGPNQWFAKDDAFDETIRLRFESVHHAAARGEFEGWMDTAEGALALLILLDQFPRNLYRGSAHAFATDPLARSLAAQAVARGFDQATDPPLRMFFYLPFEHSEDPVHQARAVALFEALAGQTGNPDEAGWALGHQAIITRFGRFPHRNRCLGRATTAQEQAFLDGGGFAG